MIAKNFKELTKEMQKKVDETLKDKNGVFRVVKEAQQEMINKEVYQSYAPEVYTRRKNNGGLIDDNNFILEVDNGVLTVTNVAEPNKSIIGTEYMPSNRTRFAEWIEYGQVPNIFNDNDYIWQHERPFTQKTKEKLASTKEHLIELKKGLKKQGLDVD